MNIWPTFGREEVLRLKECLDLDEKSIQKIKDTTTFFPASDVCRESQNQALPPFENAVIGHIIQRLKSNKKQDRFYPSLAQIFLSPPGDDDSSPKTSDNRNTASKTYLIPSGFSRFIPGLLSLRVGFIDLSDGEEPILHPHFHEFIRACIKSGFDLGLLTSASWSDWQMVDLVVDGFSFLRVNLDASNDQVYNRIHHPKHPYLFQKVVKNIEIIIRERDRRKSQLTVGAETQLTQANMNFAEEITSLVRDLGMDYIQLRISCNQDPLLPEQIRTVKELTEELKSVFRPFPIYAQIDIPRIDSGCRLAQFQLTVNAYGDLFSCPCIHEGPGNRLLGNIFNQPIEKLWFNPQHRQVIESLEKNKCKLSECRWQFCNHLLSFTQK